MAKQGRRSRHVRLARMLQNLPLGWLRSAEKLCLRQHANDRGLKMIILLALPRSGSTLTYQTIIHTFQPVYLSNLSNVLYQCPLMGGWISRRCGRDYVSDFASDHGFVPGLWGPAEGLRFWEYWLGCGLDERTPPRGSSVQQHARLHHLRRVMSCLSSEAAPLLTGFLGHALIPDVVQEAFPEAVIVRLRREPLANALSILKCRRATSAPWFSLFPRECARYLGGCEHEQVAAQVYWLNRRLDEACRGSRVIQVDYEDLCDDPRYEMRKLAEFCRTFGIRMTARQELPERFFCRRTIGKSDSDHARLRDVLDELERDHGKLSKRMTPTELSAVSPGTRVAS